MESTKLRQFFSANIRYLRKKYHLSQRSLAALLEIGVGSLRRLEHGEFSQRVTVHTLHRTCLVFGVSADVVLSEYLDPRRCGDSSVGDGC